MTAYKSRRRTHLDNYMYFNNNASGQDGHSGQIYLHLSRRDLLVYGTEITELEGQLI